MDSFGAALVAKAGAVKAEAVPLRRGLTCVPSETSARDRVGVSTPTSGPPSRARASGASNLLGVSRAVSRCLRSAELRGVVCVSFADRRPISVCASAS